MLRRRRPSPGNVLRLRRRASAVAPTTWNVLTEPTMSPISDAQTPSNGRVPGTYSSSAAGVSSIVPTYYVNGVVQTAAFDLAEGQSVYFVETVTDLNGNTFQRTSNTIVTSDATAPAFTSGPTTASTVENNLPPTYVASYPANDSGTYTLSGPDAAAYTIDAVGDLRATIAFDADVKNSYSVTINFNDGFATVQRTLTHTITNVLDAASLGPLTLSNNVIPENAAAGAVVGAVQGRATGSTLSLTDTAGSRFAISGSNVVRGATALDYETAVSHSITIRETLADSPNSPRDTVLTVNVGDVADTGTLNALTLTANNVTENTAADGIIGDLVGRSTGSTLSLTDTAGGRFKLVGITILTDSVATNYEAAQSHNITVREALTGATNTPRDTVLNIVVGNVNEAPTLIDLGLVANTIAEDAAAATVVGAISNKAGGSTITLLDDAGARFAISGTNIVRGATALNYEAATNHNITIRETLADSPNSPRDTVLNILVTNVPEGANLGTLTLSANTMPEGALSGVTVGAISGKTAGSTLTMTNTAGNRFALSGLNVIAGTTLTDYEAATSHLVTIQETLADSPNSPRSTSFTINITDVTEGTGAGSAYAFLGGEQGVAVWFDADAPNGSVGIIDNVNYVNNYDGNVAGKVSVGRSGSAYTINSSGRLTAVAANLWRNYFDPSTLANRGVVSQNAVTQLLHDAGDLSVWVNGTEKLALSAFVPAETIQTGPADLQLVKPTTSNGVHGLTQTITLPAAGLQRIIMWGRFASGGGYDRVGLWARDLPSAPNNGISGVFNTNTGLWETTPAAAGTGANVVTALTYGALQEKVDTSARKHWLVWVSFLVPATSTATSYICRFYVDSVAAYVGVVTQGLYMGNLFAGNGTTFPVGWTPSAKGADNIRIPLSQLPWSVEEGAYTFNARTAIAPPETGTVQTAIEMGSTANERLGVERLPNRNLQFYGITGGVEQWRITAPGTAPADDTDIEVAISWSRERVAISLNGSTTEAFGTYSPPVPDGGNLYFGRGVAETHWNSTFRRI